MKGFERHLRASVALERLRNFRRAAEHVGISQPALSVMISELEKRLGAPLFHRTTRTVQPTDYAITFLNDVARLFDDLDLASRSIQEIGNSKRGRLTVSCLASIASRLMPRVLAYCWEHYPELEIVVRDDVATNALQAVIDGNADFTVTGALPLPPSLSSEWLFRDPVYVCFRDDHRFAASSVVTWRQLDKEPLILLATSSGMRSIVDAALTEAQVTPLRRIEASHLSTIHGMLEAGLGVTVLPRLGLPSLVNGLLARRIARPQRARDIHISWRRDRKITPAADGFLTAVRVASQEFGERNSPT